MVEDYPQTLRIESLKARHLSLLVSDKQTNKLRFLQFMLMKEWLANAEENLQGIVPIKQPRSLVALESNHIVAVIVISPNNRRGTSCSISVPIFIIEPTKLSRQQIQQSLIQAGINLIKTNSHGCLIKCPINDIDTIGISRELGFQPLKYLLSWRYKNQYKSNHTNDKIISQYPLGINFVSINKKNAPLLLRLKQVNEPVQLRQILDLQLNDILDSSNKNNGLIVSNKDKQIAELAGLIKINSINNNKTYELVKDFAWDIRLCNAIPVMLDEILKNNPQIIITINKEDENLNKMFQNLGWENINEEIILGRGQWKRKINHNLLEIEKSIGGVFESLKPNQPPLPSPTIPNNFK